MSERPKAGFNVPPHAPPDAGETEPTSAEDTTVAYGASADWSDEESSTRTTEAVIAVQDSAAPASRQSTRALLTVVSGSNAGKVHSIRGVEALLGRAKEAHVRVDDAGASRLHAKITVDQEGRYILEDLGSTNGTFVDGRRIDRYELASGARIHIGVGFSLSFSIVDAQTERMTHQLYESSVRDALTRAHNRRYLVERLGSEIAYSRRHETRLALIMFDIDHFKRINDVHGHLAGDDVLREISALVSRLIRAEDVFARFGGEEFVVLARGIEHASVGRFAERLRSAVERLEIALDADIIHVTISAGYASLDELEGDQREGEKLLRLADERLYRAKDRGRNRVYG